MPVVILCGGRGTRLREETDFRPKPMIEIGSKPLLWHIMKIYAHYGYSDFVLCLGYKGEMIKDYFLNYEVLQSDFTIELGNRHNIRLHTPPHEHGWKITLAHTGLNAMTGARVKLIERYITSDLFMLTYGDGLANVDLTKLLEFHRSHGKIGTVTGVYPPSRFGELDINGNQVIKFSEKAPIFGGRINGGYFVFDRRIFSYITTDDNCIFEREPLTQLAADGELMIFTHDGFWQCMDTLRDMELLCQHWESGKAEWKLWKE
ncbi:MAG: glucose-1-phosphate cytidylyltransferase [Candidatus Schekmanbacteria bacterium]|nr:glucose-1-phosphate cytidylyltransferase [Candidatus Schekmanbacteria bacterium]